VLAFFFGAARFLAATLFATFFFARELDLLASIAVHLSKTAPTTVVLAALAVAAAAAAASATSPANALASSAALFPAATTVSCTLVIMGLFASIAVATLSKTTLAAVVLAALAVAAALATSPASALAPSAALFPAAIIASCALDMMPLLVISTPAWLSSRDLPVAAQISTLEGGRCEFRDRWLNAPGQCPLWVEAGRNVEVMWLTGRLTPDDKTIADFRKDSGSAIKQVCVQFIELCRLMGLLTTASVAIDGSKFKAVNTRDKNFTRGKVERRRAQLEKSVARYLAQLDTADLQEPSEELAAKTAHLKENLVKLESEMQRLAAMEKLMLASPDQQVSLTDPDSRSMATSGRGSGVVGYNVQLAVDTKHHLIVTHDVTNDGSDRAQLANIACEAKKVISGHSVKPP
jgi:hypothetical protein